MNSIYEKQIMTLISSAGASRSMAFEALQSVKNKDFKKARELLQKSKNADVEAHNMQTKMITKAIQGEDEEKITLLMVHAQDHYMCAQLARDLIEELINIFEKQDKEK